MKRIKEIFLIALVSILFVGCGTKEPEGNETENVALNIAKGEYTEGSRKFKINYGGVFRINEVEDFKNLHPHSMVDAVSFRLGSQIYQGLFRLNQKTLEAEICLAESYEVNENATLWTFKLRDNIYFHDDACFPDGKGRKVTVEDVQYCLEKLCEPHSDNKLFELFQDRVKGANEHYSGKSDHVEGIKITGDNTISIELVNPFSTFTKVLSHNACWIFPKEAFEKYGSDLRAHCVGTGPFKVDAIKEGQQVRLVRNDNYWEYDEHGNQLPYLQVIKTTFTKDKKAELSNFRRGNLDMIWKLPVDEMQSVLVDFENAKNGGNTEFQYQQKRGLATQFYSFLHTSEIFGDKNIRKAFNLAIDRDKLVKYTLQGEGEPGIHGIIPDFEGYDNSSVQGFSFNPDEAKRLMQQAGYPNGKGFPETILYINEGGSTNLILAEAIQKMLSENIGVNIKVEPLQLPVHIERFTTGQEDFWRIAWIADYPDPENFLKLFYGKTVPEDNTASSFPNFSRFKNENFDQLYEKALATIDDDMRDKYFHQCDSILVSEAAFMPIYYDEYIRLLQLKVKAFPQNAMEYRDFSRVFFSDEE